MVLISDSSHLMCQLEDRGEPEKGVVCLQHIFLQFVFNKYSFPSRGGGRGGKEGAYYTFCKEKQLLLVSFLMISAEETSSATKRLI